jgi:GNAT superfamily N-acetyltransferase
VRGGRHGDDGQSAVGSPVSRRQGRISGSVRLCEIADGTGEFGMLVADPDQGGTGVGRALVDFLEQRSRDRGLRAVQLELLVPRAWRHPSKEFVRSWYERRGYRAVRTGRLDDAYPHLAALLAMPCDVGRRDGRVRLRTQRAEEAATNSS